MAKRRSLFDSMATPASPMTPKGGSMETHEDEPEMAESKETFRRRTTPVTGFPQRPKTTLQEILATLNGAQ